MISGKSITQPLAHGILNKSYKENFISFNLKCPVDCCLINKCMANKIL